MIPTGCTMSSFMHQHQPHLHKEPRVMCQVQQHMHSEACQLQRCYHSSTCYAAAAASHLQQTTNFSANSSDSLDQSQHAACIIAASGLPCHACCIAAIAVIANNAAPMSGLPKNQHTLLVSAWRSTQPCNFLHRWQTYASTYALSSNNSSAAGQLLGLPLLLLMLLHHRFTAFHLCEGKQASWERQQVSHQHAVACC
jgi:hypothetical protein